MNTAFAVLIALGLACGGGSTTGQTPSMTKPIRRLPWETTCASGANRLAEQLTPKLPVTRAAYRSDRGSDEPEEPTAEIAKFLLDRCLVDAWSEAARRCATDDGMSCLSAYLEPWQAGNLVAVFGWFELWNERTIQAAFPGFARCSEPGCGSPGSACRDAIGAMIPSLRETAIKSCKTLPPDFLPAMSTLIADACVMFEWSPASRECFAQLGLVEACTSLLTEKQKQAENVIAMLYASLMGCPTGR